VSNPLRIAVLGATGSVGRQALEVIDRYPDRFEVFGLVSGRRTPDRHARFTVQAGDPDADARIEELVTHPECDLVLVAIAGAKGLRPTLAALEAGKPVALATKEVLVMAGGLVEEAAARGAGEDMLRPVDSEHSAIWQCLWGESRDNVARLVLTASGGPFWGRPEVALDDVTIEQALNHPRWSMGPKITIDSATMMNKGLELIEAHHLFGLPLDSIDVVVHPQSIVHSMVEFVDGSIKAQLGLPDMRLPIAVALAFPDRLPAVVPASRLEELGSLDFMALDSSRFPAVDLARRSAARGAPCPAILNAANEEAVMAFLEGEIRFGQILELVESAVAGCSGSGTSLDDILAADMAAREHVRARKAQGRV
jgi:1-deoxy-D-xylulose-5-phosphate reductoisomerase